MEKNVKKPSSSPIIILVGIGAVIDAVLFYYMFKFADEGNLLMVLLTSALIVVVAVGVTRGIAYISRHKLE
jgi:hypothetical protein